jgi:glycosyltransferase involved in cell wall biosynthesis
LTAAYVRRFWGACAAIIAPSSELAEEIRVRLPPSRRGRVHVVPTGVDVGGIRALAPVDVRARAGWPPDAIVVASLGRLAPEKSVGILLDAFEAIVEGAPEARLLLVGGGPSEGELRARSERPPLRGRVHLTGALPRPDALSLLRGADLFAFASRTETQGLVLAEALAAGLPSVAVAGPGVADSIRDGVDGVIVPADPAATRADRLGGALTRLAADPDERGRLAERAAADAERFDLTRRVAEVETIYSGLLRGG